LVYSLVIGSGRTGKAILKELDARGRQAVNIAGRSVVVNKEFLENLKHFEAIYWCARDAGIPGDQENCKDAFFDLLNSFKDAKWQGIFVYFSTAGEIYGNTSNDPNSESSSTNPFSLYGKNKLVHELKIMQLAEKVGFKGLILRIANIYEVGLEDPGIIGATLRHILLKNELKIFGGNQERDFILLEEVAQIVVDLQDKECSGILNVATGHAISILNLVKLLEKSLDTVARPNILQEFNGVSTANFDISKLKSILAYSPRVIEEVIASKFT